MPSSGIVLDMVRDTLDQRVLQALIDRPCAPFGHGDFTLAVLFAVAVGDRQQALGGVGITV
jgi:hypothetical protein